MSISIKITTFLRFLVFLYELAPGRKNEHLQNASERQNARCTFAKTPRSAKTLDVLGKCGPHVQLSGLMFNCVQLRSSCSLFSCLGRAHTQPLLLAGFSSEDYAFSNMDVEL